MAPEKGEGCCINYLQPLGFGRSRSFQGAVCLDFYTYDTSTS